MSHHKRDDGVIVADEACPDCGGELSDARQFNTMFKTFVGPVEDEASVAYLRPETAQGIFVNFDNVLNTTRSKLPFGIAQQGKSVPQRDHDRATSSSARASSSRWRWSTSAGPAPMTSGTSTGVSSGSTGSSASARSRSTCACASTIPSELAHYSSGTTDIEYFYPMGWAELEGIAKRTDYDLKTARRSRAASGSSTSMRRRTSTSCRTWSSRPSASTAAC